MSNITPYYDIECFRNIIGLSRIDCECFEANNDWDESYSNIFLDEAEGLHLRMIDAVKDCENDNNLWLLMNTARGNAIRQVIDDTRQKLLQEYQLSRSNFKGVIGRYDYKNDRTLNNTYAGQRWRTANVVGGYARITDIATFFNVVGTVDVDIYNNLNEAIGTVTLDTANGKKMNTTDILLPLWDKRIDNLEYIFIYTYDPANKPKDNEYGCGSCGIKYSFNCKEPYYRSKSNKLAGWAKWLMAGNIEQDTLDFMDLDCCAGNYTNGLSFTVEMWCDLAKQYCFDEPDKNDPIFLTLAFAIQHQAAVRLIISILTSPNVSRYTMVNAESFIHRV